MIVQPLIIDVIMEKKKYQLVAWTRNVEGQEDPELHMIPTLHFQMQEVYFDEIARCRKEEEQNNGYIGVELAERFVRVYEQNARYMFRTGYYGDGLRFFRCAAFYCRHRGEFLRLTREFISLAQKYGRHDILTEKKSKELLELHFKKMRAWN